LTTAGTASGADALSGLGRAFFYAGSRSLLITNWSVDSASARALVTDLFRRQAADPSLARGEALRRAMMALVDEGGRVEAGKMVYSYAHPLFWAPYSIVGEGGAN
jgi:CHAT domain-containing protein